jgi:cell division septation protein DedD
MIDIAKHISKLVRTHELVIIPGLGGFLTVSHPAMVHLISNRITPPGRNIAFNAQLKDNDGFLAHSIAQFTSLSYKEALGLVETFAAFCHEELQSGGRILFENLGIISLNNTGHLVFSPDLSLNYDDNYFGLPDILVMPIQRTRTFEPVITINPNARKTIQSYYPQLRRVAAVAIPLVTIGVLGWLVREPVSQYFHKQSASLVKTSSENIIPAFYKNTEIVDSMPKATPEKVANNTTLTIESQIVKDDILPVSGSYHIIAGAFSNEEFARRFVSQLKTDGFNAYVAGQNSRGLYRVSIGNYSDSEQASQQLKWYQSNKNSAAWLLHEEL